MKFDKKILLIGLGFFTVTVAWAVYNAFVPIFLDRMIENTVFIGFIMTFDNISGVLLQPYFGSLSDRTKTRFGRRMPFLMIGIPIAALALSLIPFHVNLLTLMAAIIVMNFGMSVYRAPVVAMMPDCTPEHKRSNANGIINFMGGLGTLIAFLLGGMLFDLNEKLPFIASAVIMLLAVSILFLFYKEPPQPLYEQPVVEKTGDDSDFDPEDDSPSGLVKKAKSLMSEHRELIAILFAIFFLFCGYNAIETYLSLYSTYILNITPGEASTIFALLAGAFLVFTIPAGFIGEKLGRLKSMIIGLAVITSCLCVIMVYPVKEIVQVLMIVNGFSWALVMINSYPYVVSLAPSNRLGKYTGYYYFFSFFASIVSPLLFGAIVNRTKDYKILFVYSAVMFTLALCILVPLWIVNTRQKKAD
jgi:maltose/moltooligosaccharide transporter